MGLVTATTTQTIPARVTYGAFDSGAISYTAATRAVTAFGTTIIPNTMGASLVQTNDSLLYTYAFVTSSATLAIYRGSTDTTYVGYVRDDKLVNPVSIASFALIGAPTLANELPSAGAATTYRLTVAQIGTSLVGQTLVVDMVNRRISGTVAMMLTGNTAAVNVVFRGNVDAQTGLLDGTAMTADGAYSGAYSGAFHGRLYGPASVEIGLIFNLTDHSGNDLPGIILGRTG